MKLRAGLTEKQFHLTCLLDIKSEIVDPSEYEGYDLKDWFDAFPMCYFYYYDAKTKKLHRYDRRDFEGFGIVNF